jgi:hypothetical protein
MKSVLLGCFAAAIIAYGAYHLLNVNVQQSADQRHATEGVRL